MSDRSGKTEQPTQQRLKKARKEGNFPQAKEFVSALQFVVFLMLLGTGGAHWFSELRLTTRTLFASAFTQNLSIQGLSHIAWQLFWRHEFPSYTKTLRSDAIAPILNKA